MSFKSLYFFTLFSLHQIVMMSQVKVVEETKPARGKETGEKERRQQQRVKARNERVGMNYHGKLSMALKLMKARLSPSLRFLAHLGKMAGAK